jgi:circadian clock protein KaiC
MNAKATIRRLPTGVPGLDRTLGGGLPEFSFNLIAGAPGTGKTTLAHQVMFALASPKRQAVYFTVTGEPPLKMLRYQQQFSFFEVEKVSDSVHFVNLADDLSQGGYTQILARIKSEVERHAPGLVFVDSFRSLIEDASRASDEATTLQGFIQRIGVLLTSWHATTFLVGEFLAQEGAGNPVFTVADGILWLSQDVHCNSTARRLQVMKMRGQRPLSGLHSFRIDADGFHVFPRAIIAEGERQSGPPDGLSEGERLATGVSELDAMMGGGIIAGSAVLVVGPTGSGKTMLAAQFLAEGVRLGASGVVAAFGAGKGRSRNRMLDGLVHSGAVGFLDTDPLDLSTDETLHALTDMSARRNAKRVVIDSISGFELALAPTFRDEFRESLYRVVATLTRMGITVLMTSELEDRYGDLRFDAHGTAFLTVAVFFQRYVVLYGELVRAIAVVKVRNSSHSTQVRRYVIDERGLVVGPPLLGYEGLFSGRPSAVKEARMFSEGSSDDTE